VINVFDDDWGEGYPQKDGYRANHKRVKAGSLAVGVYELVPLGGTPTLRTPEGDTAPLPAGRDGAHQVYNKTNEPVRYMIAAHHVTPEVVEYPDSGKLAAMAMSESHRGGPLWTWHRFDDSVDFFDGEEPNHA